MASPEQKSDAAAKPPIPEHRAASDTGRHDVWGGLSGQLLANPSVQRLETRALAAALTIAVDAGELYARISPPEKTHNLYRTADVLESIRPSDVVQGGVNDCFFMASLAAVAGAAPQLIKDAIKSNADGSYTVTFAGAKDSPIQTPALTESELQNYAKDSPDGVWPAVMEKAFGIYLRDHPDEKDRILGRADKGIGQSISNWFDNHLFDSFKDPQQLADNGDATAVLKLLTGYQPGGLPLKDGHSVEGAKSTLESAFAEGKALPTVAVVGEDNKAAQSLGLHAKHAYTVLGYKDGVVTMRDPTAAAVPNEQGKTMPNKAGVFEMKVEDFARAYDAVYTGRLQPLFSGGGAIMGFHRLDLFENKSKEK